MGFETTIRSIGGSIAKAGKAAAPELKAAAATAYVESKAGLTAASDFIKVKHNGNWISAAKGFAHDRPLVTGAAVVTGGVVATNAVFGRHRQREMVRNERTHEVTR